MTAPMPSVLDPDLRRALAERIRYCHEMGIYDFYRRESRIFDAAVGAEGGELASTSREQREEMAARKSAIVSKAADKNFLQVLTSHPEQNVADPIAALKLIREDLGDCTRCKLHKQGRKQIVFGVGNARAELMFVGEGPGADEDTQGEPFVGRAGQLLNNMIAAMSLKRSEVYIANIVKCRPPQNRVPEPEEANTCTQFLFRQIDIIRPQVIVALGATAATYLLGGKSALARLRGRLHEARGTKLIVTYHPAYLLRDPTQKKEAWKDLQLAMTELGLKPTPRPET